MIPRLAVLFLALVLSGCATSKTYRLPPISADEITVVHTDSFGNIKARASGIKITDSYLTAAEAEWEVSYPFWHDIVTAKNYRQKRP